MFITFLKKNMFSLCKVRQKHYQNQLTLHGKDEPSFTDLHANYTQSYMQMLAMLNNQFIYLIFKISGMQSRFFYSCFFKKSKTHVKILINLIEVISSVFILYLNISNSPIQKFKLNDNYNYLIVQDLGTQSVAQLEIFMLLLFS